MRRTQRVDRTSAAAEAEGSTTRRSRGRSRKPTWVPRARRLKIDTPVRYRVKNLGSWYEGTIANLSQSGVLLLGPQRFPDNTLVEMVFEMPEEISGQKNSTVLCQGRITRTKEDSAGKLGRQSRNGEDCSQHPRLQIPAPELVLAPSRILQWRAVTNR